MAEKDQKAVKEPKAQKQQQGSKDQTQQKAQKPQKGPQARGKGSAKSMPKNPITSTLNADQQKVAGRALQKALVDLIDLSLVTKQVHWAVVGPHFRSVHLALDEVVADARAFTDEVAERATAIGVTPDGRADTVARTSALARINEGFTSDDAVIDITTDALAVTVTRLRKSIKNVGDVDPVTEDLLIGITARLEQLHWMWQAQAV